MTCLEFVCVFAFLNCAEHKQNMSGNTVKKKEESEQMGIQVYFLQDPKDRICEPFVSSIVEKVWRYLDTRAVFHA